MKIVNAPLLSCFLASVAFAQDVSSVQAPPEFEVPVDWPHAGIRINRIEFADGTCWQR